MTDKSLTPVQARLRLLRDIVEDGYAVIPTRFVASILFPDIDMLRWLHYNRLAMRPRAPEDFKISETIFHPYNTNPIISE